MTSCRPYRGDDDDDDDFCPWHAGWEYNTINIRRHTSPYSVISVLNVFRVVVLI